MRLSERSARLPSTPDVDLALTGHAPQETPPTGFAAFDSRRGRWQELGLTGITSPMKEQKEIIWLLDGDAISAKLQALFEEHS